ncbi:MAG TPA: response regulator [Terracidiphilus sp.]
MTTESTQPQPELGPSPANGQGQSQGHRRRRRRRKNKSSRQGAAPGQVAQLQQQPQPATPAPQAQAPPPKPQGPPRQNQARKKKKFFTKGSAPQQPGNSVSGMSQGKRKGKQRGPREFVGPMDHSYRAVNGNVADGPASTIQISNGHGSYHPELYQAPASAAPIRHDAPTRIFCFIDDLFFQAKIQETARKLGVKVEFVKGGDKEGVARITDVAEADRPRLLVFDLNNANAKPMTLIPKFKAKLKKATSIVGFLSHLQGDLKIKATEVGCDTVMPRSAFSQSLPNLLRRYGLEEEEEYVPQPM